MKIPRLILLLLFTMPAVAQQVDSLALVQFSDAVLELQNSELFRHGTLAVSVKTVNDSRSVFAINQERSLPSASTLKLVTTATALSLLSGEFRYQTFLEYDGEIRRDTLHGNLYIRGTGDPSLGSDRLKDYPNANSMVSRWKNALERAGIRVIRGRVLPDPSVFAGNTVADSWIFSDLGNYYGAGVSGLNFNENLYRVKFKAGVEVGDPTVSLGTEPAIPYLTFSNRVVTGERGSGDQTVLYSNPLSNQVVMRGTIPAGSSGFTVKGSIPDPAGYAAYAFRQTLEAASVGIMEVADSLLQKPGNARKVLDEYKSPPLRELCQQANWWSINLYADAFFRTAGVRLDGKSDYNDAAKSITNYWRNRGADVRGFYIKDGSGLSPSGSLTTQNLTDILARHTTDKSFQDFYNSIAIVGKNGTVRNLAKGVKTAGNIRAKSGSIEGTRAYAGYVTTKSGAMLSFAFIAHKYQTDAARIVSEELVRLMTLLTNL